jgi:hypothetical protein
MSELSLFQSEGCFLVDGSNNALGEGLIVGHSIRLLYFTFYN